MSDSTAPLVRAAGGVVSRRGAAGDEVLLVHRPRYDDWTFPKGKCDPGETDEQAALREVLEETGFACRLGVELVTTRYRDRFGRPKQVRYWAMSIDEGTFEPNEEVDEVRWVTPAEAARLLTYPRDRELLTGCG